MSVKVTTEVAEVEASKTPSDEQGQARAHASLVFPRISLLLCKACRCACGFSLRVAVLCHVLPRKHGMIPSEVRNVPKTRRLYLFL